MKGTKLEDLTSLGIMGKCDADWGKGFFKGMDVVMLVAEGINNSLKNSRFSIELSRNISLDQSKYRFF